LPPNLALQRTAAQAAEVLGERSWGGR